jgi:hypothetical protein
MMEGQPWPTKLDHESAMDALLRLQYVYNLDLKEVQNCLYKNISLKDLNNQLPSS